MQLVTRSQWGARPRGAGATTPFDPQGCAVHWEGAGWPLVDGKPWAHGTCDDKMRAMQDYHMDGRGWSDIAYSFVACPHGYVFEGRGLNRRSAANGNYDTNTDWYAVQCMWGSRSGSAPADLLVACRDAIDYCRTRGGAGTALRGHRDLKQTDCPGDQIYAWVRRGAPRPTEQPPEDDMTDEQFNTLVAKMDQSIRQAVSDTQIDMAQTEILQRVETALANQRRDLGVQFTAVHDKLDQLAGGGS